MTLKCLPLIFDKLRHLELVKEKYAYANAFTIPIKTFLQPDYIPPLLIMCDTTGPKIPGL